jgi:tetratricopeptide (TPR) repeat protein
MSTALSTGFRIIVLLVFVSVNARSATNPAQLFSEANKSYRAGRYEIAEAKLEELLKGGHKTAAVYFNLGNCYYKQQDFAHAILNYERAKRMNPLDDDIQYNLKLAYNNTVDKIEPIPRLFYERWWEIFLNYFSPSGWSWIAIVVLWLAIGFGAWYLYAGTIATRKSTFLTGTSLFFMALFLFFVASCSNKRLNHDKAAIVTEPTAYVRSSPDTKSTNLFMLHAGTRIEIIDQQPGWKQIRIANGNVGWMDDKQLDAI